MIQWVTRRNSVHHILSAADTRLPQQAPAVEPTALFGGDMKGFGQRSWAFLCGALGVAVGLVPAGGPAGAQTEVAPTVARADAAGSFVQFGIPGFLPIDNYADAALPWASAVRESGRTVANAALPYPGDAALSAPALGGLLLGVVLPSYPLYVRAEHPTQPEQVFADPTGVYSLAAKANGDAANSTARLGAPAAVKSPALGAASEVVATGETVVARALSSAEGVVVGPLSLASVRSRSTTSYRHGDPRPVSQTELVVEGAKAADVSFSLAGGVLLIGEQKVPVPLSDGAAALNAVLAPAGLSLRFIDPKQSPDGATAAAIEITGDKVTVPGAGAGRLVLRLGGSSSSVFVGDISGSEDPADSGPSYQSSTTNLRRPVVPGVELREGGVPNDDQVKVDRRSRELGTVVQDVLRDSRGCSLPVASPGRRDGSSARGPGHLPGLDGPPIGVRVCAPGSS